MYDLSSHLPVCWGMTAHSGQTQSSSGLVFNGSLKQSMWYLEQKPRSQLYEEVPLTFISSNTTRTVCSLFGIKRKLKISQQTTEQTSAMVLKCYTLNHTGCTPAAGACDRCVHTPHRWLGCSPPPRLHPSFSARSLWSAAEQTGQHAPQTASTLSIKKLSFKTEDEKKKSPSFECCLQETVSDGWKQNWCDPPGRCWLSEIRTIL